MPRRMRLSDGNVARLRPEAGEYTVWDTRTSGLGVRVRRAGTGRSSISTAVADPCGAAPLAGRR